MRKRLIAGLAAAIATLGWILLFERGEPESDDEGASVFAVAADDVLAASIERPGEPEVRLTRTDAEGWVVREGEGAPAGADPGEVDLLLQNLTSLRSEREIPEASDLERFGLAPAQLSVEVETADGAFRAGFGSETPVAGNRYLLSGDAVLVVPAFSRNNFDRTAWDLRDKRLFRLDTPAARRVVLTADDDTVAVAREDGVWRILRPFRFGADPYEAATLANRILDADMLGPGDSPPEDAFDAPRLSASFEVVTGPEEITRLETLEFGVPSDSPPGVFVRRTDGATAVVAQDLLDDLAQAVEEGLAGVRSLGLFRFAAFRTMELRIESPTETLTFRRGNGEEGRTWTLSIGAGAPVTVDPTSVEDLLYRLNSTEADEVAAAGDLPAGDLWTLTALEDADYGGSATEETVRLSTRAEGPIHALRTGDERALTLSSDAWRGITDLIESARAPRR